jgi:hypothetical protein
MRGHIGFFFVHSALFFVWPVYLAIVAGFLGLWFYFYARAWRRRKKEDRPRDNTAYLLLNHITLCCLILSAIYCQWRFLTGGIKYRLTLESAGRFMSEYTREVASTDALGESAIFELLTGENRHGKANAASIFAHQKNHRAVSQLIEEMKNSDDEYFPPKPFIRALQQITQKDWQTREEWLRWWEENKGDYQLK